MGLPPDLRAKYVSRFDELVRSGTALHAQMEHVPGEVYENIDGRPRKSADRYVIDWPSFVEWRTKCKSLLSAVIPDGHPHRATVEHFSALENQKGKLEYAIATMRALCDDFRSGMFDGLQSQIEAEVAADYMGQAEQLLKEGQSGKYDHVPAAVLAGAVLEKGLRALCAKQTPPVATTGADGKPLTLNPLIDALKKSGAFNELTAKQLRAWADIRNKAAHGEFDQFKRDDVETMLKGVGAFLALQAG